MCDCISEIVERITKEKQADLVTVENGNSTVRFTNLRPNSIIYKRPHYLGIAWRYCPFCGERK